jgi:hypothetical protein
MDNAHARTPEAVEAAFHDAWNDIPLDLSITSKSPDQVWISQV